MTRPGGHPLQGNHSKSTRYSGSICWFLFSVLVHPLHADHLSGWGPLWIRPQPDVWSATLRYIYERVTCSLSCPVVLRVCSSRLQGRARSIQLPKLFTSKFCLLVFTSCSEGLAQNVECSGPTAGVTNCLAEINHSSCVTDSGSQVSLLLVHHGSRDQGIACDGLVHGLRCQVERMLCVLQRDGMVTRSI